MERWKKLTPWAWVAGAIFVYILFYYISVRTPLAGDDWGYALNGTNFNPFVKAWEFYFTWSGRFFSELWGFLIAPRKWLWNILNPALFCGIYILLYQIIKPKRNQIACAITILAMMLTVKDWVRMETYTWIMGTTYVVPLFLMLVSIWLMKRVILEEKSIKPYHYACLVGLNFYIGLAMENIAGANILFNILLVIYAWFQRKDALKLTITGLVVSVLSFILLRCSPGATYRLNRDNQAWMQMGLLSHIQYNWQNFLRYTFTDNKIMILILSSISSLLVLQNGFKKTTSQKQKIGSIIQLVILGLALVACVSPTLYGKTHWEFFRLFYDYGQWNAALVFCSILYLAYIVNCFWILATCYKEKSCYEKLTYFMLAGTCNLAMMLSPIFGSRSSLYTIYFIILLTVSILAEIELHPSIQSILILFCLVMSYNYSLNWKRTYNLVATIQTERESILQYYREHPEDKEAWIPRMPASTVHSANIEEGDTYHEDVFKEYYGLDPDMILRFFFKNEK